MCDSESERRTCGPARAILLAALTLSLLSACMPYELKSVLDGPQGKPLSVTPTSTVVIANNTISFVASGGVGPYVYALVSGPAGLNTATGAYRPVTAGSAVIRVTDKTGKSVDATVTIQPLGTALAISPAAITLSIGASITFVPIGGSGTYTFSMQSNPSGGAVNAAGLYVAGSTPSTTDVVLLTDTVSSVTATVSVVPFSTVDYTITGTTLTATGTVSTALPGGQSFTLKNIGTGAGTQAVDWKVYLSANATLDAGDSLVASGTTSALAAGASTPVTVTGGIFPAAAPGPYFLIVQISSNDDTTPGNDVSAASPVTLAAQNIDYVSNPVSSTGGTPAGGAMAGSFTIRNQGSAAGGDTVLWQVRASTDTTLDASDYVLAGGTIAGLGAGATSSTINFTGTWPSTPGPWYLIAYAISADDISLLNNVSVPTLVTTTGVAPANVDYVVSSVTNGGGTTTGRAISGSFVYTNNGSNAGTQPVYWTAYVSVDTTLQLGTDTVIDSGTLPSLGATTGSGPVPFTGTWPAAPGTLHLIVAVSSSDDIVPTNNAASSAAIPVSAPSVNYNIPSVNSTGGTTAGDPIAANFIYQNTGGQDGSQSVVWTAYLSSDPILQIGIDTVVDSGVVPALTASTTSGTIPFAGTWPAGPGSWYLIVSLTVAEDIAPANNTTATAAPIATTAPNVDYTVTSVTPVSGFVAGGPFTGNVILKNLGTHAGTQFVPWRAYISADAVLQIGTDPLVSSGFLPSPGLAAGASSAALPISGTWPGSTTTKSYYIIVEVGAGDDVASGNNDGVSVLVAVTAPQIDYTVTVVNNTGGTAAGGPIVGNFTLHNNGVNDGVSTINWAVHVSTDATLQVTDPIIATGSRGPLTGSATLAGIAFAGTWPVTAGTWYLIVEANAADDTNPANNWTASAAIPVTSTAPNYVITGVSGPVGSQTGLPVSGNFTVQNTGTAAGATTVNWEVYASLGNNTYDAGDTLIAAGSFGPLGISATSSPGYAGNWPMTPGTYFIVVRVFTADDSSIADVASAAVVVNAPPAPDYTVTFSPAIPWSGLVGTAMSLTGTPTLTIQNLSVNAGHQNIAWAVYLSTDNVLDAADILVQQGTTGPLLGSGTTGASFASNWPAAPGQLYFLIAIVQATDDNNATNNVVIAPHACAIGDYRYVEGAENNNAVGPSPSPQVSDTLVTTLAANQTIAIEGVMDAYNKNDTYKFTTIAGLSKLSMRAMWATGFDDIDLYLWDDGATNLFSTSTGINAEPGGSNFDVTSVTPRVCYVSTLFFLAGNTSGSTGQKYVIFVRGLP